MVEAVIKASNLSAEQTEEVIENFVERLQSAGKMEEAGDLLLNQDLERALDSYLRGNHFEKAVSVSLRSDPEKREEFNRQIVHSVKLGVDIKRNQLS